MINNIVYNSPQRNIKIISPTSPTARRQSIHTSDSNHIQTISNNANSYAVNPQTNNNYYNNNNNITKTQNPYGNDNLNDRQLYLQRSLKDLNEKMNKISVKINQHQGILLRLTEASLQNNKEQYKKNIGGQHPHPNQNNHHQNAIQMKNEGSKPSQGVLNEAVIKLRKDFQDYKQGNIITKQIQIKNKLFSELIHKSEERMKIQMQSILKKYLQTNINNNIKPISQNNTNPSNNINISNPICVDKYEELEKHIKKLQRHIIVNTNKINMAFQKIDNISSTVQGHMEIINVEVNKGLAKIVTFINEKVTKQVNQTISKLSQKIHILEENINNNDNGGGKYVDGLKACVTKSFKTKLKASYKQSLIINEQQLIINERVYYVDMDGYLLDDEYYYLMDRNEQKIKLDQNQIKMLITQYHAQ